MARFEQREVEGGRLRHQEEREGGPRVDGPVHRIVNLGADLSRTSFAEPLLAPPYGHDWTLRWSSEDPVYGGLGTADVWPDGCWSIAAESALVLRPGPQRHHPLPLVRRTA